jgi:hypothetical protein
MITAMKSKRFELVLLFMLVSWGIARGILERLLYLLLPLDTLLLSIILIVFVFGLIGMCQGLLTWLAMRWLDFNPGKRTAILLAGGFFATWIVGYSLNLTWLSRVNEASYAMIGAFCGLVLSVALRKHVKFPVWRFLIVIFLFAVIFVVTWEFNLRLVMDLRLVLSSADGAVGAGIAQSALCGMLTALVILFATAKVHWISMRRLDFVFALLAFVAGDALARLFFLVPGWSEIAPWLYDVIQAAGWGIGIALAAHRPRSIPFYTILFVLGSIFGNTLWRSVPNRYLFVSGALYALLISLVVGLFITVGVKRLVTILLVLPTAIFGAWLGNLISFRSVEFSLANWLADFAMTAIVGLVILWGMLFFGVLTPAGAVTGPSRGKEVAATDI